MTPWTIDHGDVLEIFCRGAQQRRPADINILNGIRQSTARVRHGLSKGVEVDGNDVDGLDAVLPALSLVVSILALIEDTAVNQGVQGFDPAVEHLGKTGKLRHIRYLKAAGTQLLGRAACGKNFDSHGGKRSGKPLTPRFISQADQNTVATGIIARPSSRRISWRFP